MASKQFKWWKAAVVVAVMLAFAAWLRPEPTEAQFGQPDIPEQALPGQVENVADLAPMQQGQAGQIRGMKGRGHERNRRRDCGAPL